MATKLIMSAVKAAHDKKHLNEEWVEIVNEGDSPFNGEGCSLTIARGAGRQRTVATIKAGLVVQPGERVRLVSGSSGKKSHGTAPPEDDARNFFLFLKASYLDRPGLTVRLVSHQHTEICRHAPAEEAPAADVASS